MLSGILGRLSSTAGLLCIFVLLVLVLCLRLFSAHSAEVQDSYKQGYSAAQTEFLAAAAKKSAKAVQSARQVRSTQDKRVQDVRKKADEVQSASPSTNCGFTESDLGLLNGTIDTGNSWMRVHETTGVP